MERGEFDGAAGSLDQLGKHRVCRYALLRTSHRKAVLHKDAPAAPRRTGSILPSFLTSLKAETDLAIFLVVPAQF
jgi:hypothetical protein